MIDSGLKVTINSDDPAYLGAYLTDNLLQVVDTFNLTFEHIIMFVKNAIDAAFVSEEDKISLHKKLYLWLNDSKTFQ